MECLLADYSAKTLGSFCSFVIFTFILTTVKMIKQFDSGTMRRSLIPQYGQKHKDSGARRWT